MKRLLAGLVAAVTLAAGSPGVASAGTVWTIAPVPVPSNPPKASLDGVSCWSATGCMSVGRFFYRRHGFRGHALAEQWNGTAWSAQQLRRPGATWNSSMTGISCVSAASCTAVGTASNSAGAGFPSDAAAERWNGSSWAVQPVKSPAGAGQTELSAVSCTAAARCTAVGSFARTVVSRPLAERWDGHAWAIQPTPNPSGSHRSVLSAVACASATTCMAVGTTSHNVPFGSPLAESWDGSRWTLQAMPAPPHASMTGISCASASSCVATGYVVDSKGLPAQPLAESWNGSAWTIQPTPAVSGGQAQLDAVSCVSASSCTAVGHYARGALVEYWNGSVWRQVQTTHPAGRNRLFAVSCVFPHTCTAVGQFRIKQTSPLLFHPLAEHE